MIFGEEDSRGTPQPQSAQQSIRLDLSRMETIYANLFAVAGAPDETTIYVGANAPFPGAAEPAVTISHRLIMTPANAKRLLQALQQSVKAYEDQFGPIDLALRRKGN